MNDPVRAFDGTFFLPLIKSVGNDKTTVSLKEGLKLGFSSTVSALAMALTGSISSPYEVTNDYSVVLGVVSGKNTFLFKGNE